MTDTNINFQVFCVRPGWAITNFDPKYTDVRYRIYVDNDLITERTWIWNNDTALHENIYVQFDNNINHKLKLQPVVYREDQAVFKIHQPRSENARFTIVETISPVEMIFRTA